MNLESLKTTTTWKEAVEGINGNNAKINEAIINLENGSGGSSGVADSVAWEDVTDKPEWITESKPVYSKADLDVSVQESLNKADTSVQPTSLGAGTGLTLSNLTFSVKYGTTSGTACQGNDVRLSDARKANGGNADTVNKYSIQVGSTAGTDGSTIYFVI